MLCLSGFELYSRLVPLILVLATHNLCHPILLVVSWVSPDKNTDKGNTEQFDLISSETNRSSIWLVFDSHY